MNERRQITVAGMVQGVGFRPFVYGLAVKNCLAGFVLNDAAGVTVELEGEPAALDKFLAGLQKQPPPLARIEHIACRMIAPRGECSFRIIASDAAEERRVLISPDTPTCGECLAELFDPQDRRYRYPFINCTNCGPRFTIVRDVPYDRERTTMGRFEMCADCQGEFDDPRSRRFHAQPNACARCGPRVRLLNSQGCEISDDDPIAGAALLLRQGAVIAVKGLGGYHLACDASNHEAVRQLRTRKQRQDKPFALMVADIEAARQLCFVTAHEEWLLQSVRRPIVLLRRRIDVQIAPDLAPRQQQLGLMLPYAPVHHLLLAAAGVPLVMTSGNLSDEPIAHEDQDALARLGTIAEYFLAHDRRIHMRCDDSVTRSMDHQELIIRRSRGYAPEPIAVGDAFVRPLLACGAHLKSTFCLGKGRYGFMSHHIGDLENHETFQSFVETVEHFKNLFAVEPAVIAHDLHPGYLSTQYALGVHGVPRIGVQHHHAHIACCMAEHGLKGPVIGVAFDGLGYGGDGTIWGGEFLVAELSRYERRAHLRHVPLPGGDRAIREPWRMAVSYLHDALGKDPLAIGLPGWGAVPANKIALVTAMMQRQVNTVPTSSCGRLFDAVAAILGLRHVASYEGQAAIELEMAALENTNASYPFTVGENSPWQIDMRAAIECLVGDIQKQLPVSLMAAKFHNTIVAVIAEVCCRLRDSDGLKRVCLGGGSFQNMYVLKRVVPLLKEAGFEVYFNRKVPLNDGGVALGQAAIANAIVQRGD